jgi:hypothetical protein
MLDTEIRLPVFLERIDADLSVGGDVGVEYLGEEKRLGRGLREVLSQYKLHFEHSTSVRCPS